MAAIAEEDLALLANEIRRALADRILNKPHTPPRYRPPSLRGRNAILHVVLRDRGTALAEAETAEVNLVDGAAAAGETLGRNLLNKKDLIEKYRDQRSLETTGLEMEWLGPREYVTAKFDEARKWSEELLHCFEPAAEGIGVEFQGRGGFTRPGQIVALNFGADVALQAAEVAAKLTQNDKIEHADDIRYFRFSSIHAWQDRDRSLPRVLVRGSPLVLHSEVSAEVIDEAIARIGAYLRYRQNRDGWFSEEYLPSSDRYTDSNSAPLQMHCLYGLAAYGRWSGRKDILDAANKGITKTAGFLKPLQLQTSSAPASGPSSGIPAATRQAGELLMFPGHESYLEVTARFLSAMTEARNSSDAQQAVVCEALLAAQDPSGALAIQFEGVDAHDPIAAGWALLALVQNANKLPSDSKLRQSVMGALGRARPYYQQWYQQAGEAMGCAALSRAIALGYVLTKDARDSAFAFSIMDRLVDRQLTGTECAWPELLGAIDASGQGIVGADSAYYVLTLAEGAATAERSGDRPRADRYRRAVSAGVRFLLQLEMTKDACFYVRSQRDALGGIRRALWQNGLRANNCAETLLALMRARSVLYGPSVKDPPSR